MWGVAGAVKGNKRYRTCRSITPYALLSTPY